MGRYFIENNFGQTNPIIPLFCIQRPIFLLSRSLVCCCFRHSNLGISTFRMIHLEMLFSDCPTKGPAVWAERSERRRNQQGSADKTGTERLLCADRGLGAKVATEARGVGHKRRTISHGDADMQMCEAAAAAAAGGRARETRQRLKEWSARRERRRLTARVGGSLSSSSGEALCLTTRPPLPRPLPCCPSH